MKDIQRRAFLGAGMMQLAALATAQAKQSTAGAIRVERGADRFSGPRKIAGANMITYKVATPDAQGGLFLLEQVSMRKGGPPLHMHHAQDEWFYVLEGEYVFEVGKDRMRLGPGDSLLAPRRVPHVWAYTGEKPGKILIGFMPAGKMEMFFQEAAKLGDFAADAKLYRDCEMELLGPPLSSP